MTIIRACGLCILGSLVYVLPTALSALSAIKNMKITVGASTLTFRNASLGLALREELAHQCDNTGKYRIPAIDSHVSFTYTPNRRLQQDTIADAQQEQVRLLHVLAVGYKSQNALSSVGQLLTAWDTWTDHFYPIVSNTTSLVLLFDELSYDGRTTRTEYLDSILIRNMGAVLVDCVEASTDTGPAGCAPDAMLHLDQGYRVYAFTFPAAAQQQPLIIFAAVHRFAPPAWLSESAELALLNKWKPPLAADRIPGGYEYAKMTSWYGYPALSLHLLDFFDYMVKLDDDLYFTKPFPEPNLPLQIAHAGAYMLGSGRGYITDSGASVGMQAPLDAYVKMETGYCNGFHRDQRDRRVQLRPGGMGDNTFFHTNLTVVGYFVVTWLGLFTSPENMHFGKFWNDFHPNGIWDYRWTDQQWWPRPIALFGSGDLTKEVQHLAGFDPSKVDNVFHKIVCKNRLHTSELFRFEGMTRQEREAITKHCRHKRQVQMDGSNQTTTGQVPSNSD